MMFTVETKSERLGVIARLKEALADGSLVEVNLSPNVTAFYIPSWRTLVVIFDSGRIDCWLEAKGVVGSK